MTMMRHVAPILMVSLAATITSGCDAEGSLAGGDERLFELNTYRLNTYRLNAFSLNGFRLDGFRLDGDDGTGEFIELRSIELEDDREVARAWLAESVLHVETTTGEVLSAGQLAGAVLHFRVVEGSLGKYRSRKVKIAGVAPLVSDSDVLLYRLQIRDEPGPWQPLCVDELGLPTEAILIGDAWNPETGDRISPRPDSIVTMACRHAALAKCVEWGYLPWEHGDYHQACTRAVRADYCGDGTPHTHDGVMIHVLDDLGIQDVDPGVPYALEAEWGPDGATCLERAHTRLPDPQLACAPVSCGESFASGGLIQTGVATP